MTYTSVEGLLTTRYYRDGSSEPVAEVHHSSDGWIARLWLQYDAEARTFATRERGEQWVTEQLEPADSRQCDYRWETESSSEQHQCGLDEGHRPPHGCYQCGAEHAAASSCR